MATFLEVEARRVDTTDLDALHQLASRLEGPELRDFLLGVHHLLSSGDDVTGMASSAELTPEQVARQLRMSRTHVYKLIDTGALPAHRVGRDRRVRLVDLVAFDRQREQERAELAERFAHPDRTREGAIAETSQRKDPAH